MVTVLRGIRVTISLELNLTWIKLYLLNGALL